MSCWRGGGRSSVSAACLSTSQSNWVSTLAWCRTWSRHERYHGGAAQQVVAAEDRPSSLRSGGRSSLNASIVRQTVDDRELLRSVERLRDVLLSVSTGGDRIEAVNSGYKDLYQSIDHELRTRGVANGIPFSDLWDWH